MLINSKRFKCKVQNTSNLFILLVLFVIIILNLNVRAHAINAKSLCKTKCEISHVMCLGNSTFNAPGSNECRNNCNVSSFSCINSCKLPALNITDPICAEDCRVDHASCYLGCGTSERICDSVYLDCLGGCDSRPECTSGTDCKPNGACDNHICVLACKSDQDCRSWLRTPYAGCIRSGPRKGVCMAE
jgi:hypothetical protein